eukprot:UN28175
MDTENSVNNKTVSPAELSVDAGKDITPDIPPKEVNAENSSPTKENETVVKSTSEHKHSDNYNNELNLVSNNIIHQKNNSKTKDSIADIQKQVVSRKAQIPQKEDTTKKRKREEKTSNERNNIRTSLLQRIRNKKPFVEKKNNKDSSSKNTKINSARDNKQIRDMNNNHSNNVKPNSLLERIRKKRP